MRRTDALHHKGAYVTHGSRIDVVRVRVRVTLATTDRPHKSEWLGPATYAYPTDSSSSVARRRTVDNSHSRRERYGGGGTVPAARRMPHVAAACRSAPLLFNYSPQCTGQKLATTVFGEAVRNRSSTSSTRRVAGMTNDRAHFGKVGSPGRWTDRNMYSA